MTIADVTFIDPVHGQQHIVVSSAHGGGGSFSVVINNYFRGQIVKYNIGWVSFVKSEVLTQDDIDAIMDMVEKVD